MSDDTPDPATVTATAPPGGSATAVSSPPLATTKTVVHEEASRLPDTSWLWRRILIFVSVGVCLLIAFRRSEAVTDVPTMREVIRYAFGMIALGLLLYGVGATITDVARLITAFLSTKRVTETTTPAEPPPSS